MPDDCIAFADTGFEMRAIQYGNLPSTVADEACVLQFASRFGDGFASDTQQAGDIFLGDAQFVGLETILTQHQPSAQALVHGVVTVADGGLCHLGDERLGEAEHDMLQAATQFHLPFDDFGLEL
ncbi:conserved hypothetical protein, partial [Ricinus communis]